ncbi:Retrovirus-related Pol polyprotein from transposon 17.6 [Vitis vinifera]|uniref:Retrovirus-related Pol polyprotein from transposon 17.6 n=1 Tax=Vitis vinifera TaxID=29760 RepID=A0A438CSY2_VITVI|nr:Retrovirus-related Pol polyprotein from transposon 17.6 [Vitis vinifera]
MFSFIDAFSGYHQIPMFQLDEEKTLSVTPHGLYYQRLMTKIFKPLIGHTVEVYINDIVVKNKTRGEHTRHLEKTFRLMNAYNIKLNPAKGTFGVNAGKFLGFMVTQRGIEVNPDQIKAVMETSTSSCKNELQCLTGCLVALGRFIARFTDKLRLFFLTLKRANAIERTSDYEQAFKDIKCYLTQPPILSSPQPSEQLYVYLAVFNCVVNVVLFRSVKDKEQNLSTM